MKGIKEAFIDAGEISQMLGIGMTKAYAIIKEYNAELEAIESISFETKHHLHG